MASVFSAMFGGGHRVNSPKVQPATSMRVQTAIDGTPIPIIWGQNRIAGNLIDYQDFRAVSVKTSSPSGKGGKGFGGSSKGGGPTTTWTYYAAVDIGICEGPVNGIVQVYNNSTAQSLGSMNLTSFIGDYAQSAWSYMATSHSGNALNYRGLCHAAAGPMNLGASPELPNLNFEIASQIGGAIGLPDASPKDVIDDFLTNQHYGLGFPSAYLSSLNLYQNYCLAAGIVISPVLKDQTPAADFLTHIASATNSAFRWSAGTLDLIPYGDVDLFDNGASYDAPSPQFTLNLADLLPHGSATSGAAGPVQIDRSLTSDQYNLVRIRYVNRANQYQQSTATAFDEASISAFGLRQEDPIDYTFICDATVAQTVAGLHLGRLQIRNKYTFSLGRRFIRLDPMDLVQLPEDQGLGLHGQIVRIVEISENTDGTLAITAEETLQGAGFVSTLTPQINSGYSADFMTDPGSVNTPVIFVPPGSLTGGDYEVWVAVSGVLPSVWGGCYVWASSDGGATFRQVGEITGASRQGTLTATFASAADPDTTSTLSVDLSESQGQLGSGTAADADNYNTLCYVDGELVSYQTATLTSAYHYNIGTRIRRGLYGTSIGTHYSGSLFARLDDGIGKFPFTVDRITDNLVFKFQSFNIWGGGAQDLSACTPYSFTVAGLATSYTCVNLTVGTNSFKSLQLTWVLPANAGDALQAIEIWRSPNNTFASASKIGETSGKSTTYIDDGLDTNTTYWYYVRCRDITGKTGPFTPSSAGPGVSATTKAIVGNDLSANSINASKLAAGIQTIQVVSSLGSISNPTEGMVAFLTTDGNLYRYHNGQWTALVNGALIAAGTVAATALANSIRPVQVVSNLNNAADKTEGAVAFLTGDGQLYRMHNGVWTAAVPSVNITGPITATQIADGVVTLSKFANTIEPVQVVSNPNDIPNPTEGMIAFSTLDKRLWRYVVNAPGTGWINAVDTVQLSGQITTTQIADNSISTPKLQANSVTAANILGGSISADKLVANSITAGQIAAGAIGVDELAAGAVTTNAIAAGAIAAGTIAANAVTAGTIASNAVTVGTIAAGAVTATAIAAGAIVSGSLASNAIIAGTIAAGAINAAGLMVDGVVITSKIAGAAATNHADAEATSISLPNGSWTDLVVVTAFVEGYGAVEITCNAYLYNADNGAHNCYVRLYRDGFGVCWPAATSAKTPIPNTQGAVYPIQWIESPGYGSFTYRYQALVDTTTITAYNPTISVDEIKR